MMKVWLNVCVWTGYELIEKDKKTRPFHEDKQELARES